MSVIQSTPKFTGFIRRLVEDGVVDATSMQNAIINAKKANQDIIPYLTQNLKVSSLTIAETIALEFGEPIFDLSVYNTDMLAKDAVDEKLIIKHRVLPIFNRGNLLYVATSNPTNIEAIDAIRFNSKMNVESVIVEFDKLDKLIENLFADTGNFEFSDDEFDLDV